MSGQQNQQQGAGAGQPIPNPFQPASLQRRFLVLQARKRAADSSSDDSPPKKQKSTKASSNIADYVQPCRVNDCEHVLVNVGEKPVKFTLCKARIVHESDFFRAALDSVNNFKEGQEKTIDLKDEDPKKFLLYISSIFPQESCDYGSVSFNLPKSYNMAKHLCGLFDCVDRYGSLACPNIKHRILKSLQSWRKIVCDPKQSLYGIEFLKSFSSCNMDLDADFLKELFKFDFNVTDVETMNAIKPNILHPIMAKNAAKLNKELAKEKEEANETRKKYAKMGLKNAELALRAERVEAAHKESNAAKDEMIKQLENEAKNKKQVVVEAYCGGCKDVAHIERDSGYQEAFCSFCRNMYSSLRVIERSGF